VDDDVTISRLFTRILQRHGYRVDVASTGQMAYDLLQDHNYAIVMLDVVLPDQNGLDLLPEVPAFTQKIVISGKTSHVDQKRAIQMGATYLQKPVATEVLLQTIAAYLY
jgi:two-component system OmpR family response regulator